MTEPPSDRPQSAPADPERDAETARLLAALDPEGLRRLLLDHGGKVLWTLRMDFKTVLDASEIDDALSQASERIWRFGGRFDLTRGTLRAWFYVITRNCALRILEAKRHPDAPQLVDDIESLMRSSKSVPEAARSPKSKRFARALHRCIAALPAQQRAIILADLAAGGRADTNHLVQQLKTSPNTIYVATITTGAQDATGAALLRDYTWRFTTAP